MIINIYNEDVIALEVVSLMPIPLVSIQINDHHLLYAQPSLQIVYCQSYIGIYAESTTLVAGCMVVSACKVDGPSQFKRSDGG
jgi:hypothetical protein